MLNDPKFYSIETKDIVKFYIKRYGIKKIYSQ